MCLHPGIRPPHKISHTHTHTNTTSLPLDAGDRGSHKASTESSGGCCCPELVSRPQYHTSFSCPLSAHQVPPPFSLSMVHTLTHSQLLVLTDLLGSVDAVGKAVARLFELAEEREGEEHVSSHIHHQSLYVRSLIALGFFVFSHDVYNTHSQEERWVWFEVELLLYVCVCVCSVHSFSRLSNIFVCCIMANRYVYEIKRETR